MSLYRLFGRLMHTHDDEISECHAFEVRRLLENFF